MFDLAGFGSVRSQSVVGTVARVSDEF